MEEKINTPPPAKVERGKIKWFNDVKGFGFIADKNNQEVFVHRKHISNFKPSIVEEDDDVTFVRKVIDDNLQAREVKLMQLDKKLKNGAQAKKFYKDLVRSGYPIVLKLAGKKTAEGIISRIEPYFIYLRIHQGDEIEIRKLDIKYFYRREDSFLLQNRVRVDQNIKDLGLQPIEKVKDRYKLTWFDLHNHRLNRTRLVFYLLEGESILGVVDWFTKYEINLKLTPHNSIVLYKHNLFNYRLFKRD